jgi:hypothetical protein
VPEPARDGRFVDLDSFRKGSSFVISPTIVDVDFKRNFYMYAPTSCAGSDVFSITADTADPKLRWPRWPLARNGATRAVSGGGRLGSLGAFCSLPGCRPESQVPCVSGDIERNLPENGPGDAASVCRVERLAFEFLD